MTQTTLLIVLAAILTGGILLYNTQRHAADADDRLEGQQYKGLARDAAEVGLNVVVRALAESHEMGSWNNTDFDIAPTTYNGGTFRADVQMTDGSGDLVDVIVRGSHDAGRSTIFARYEREKDDTGIPPSFRNVITAELNININGSMMVESIRNDLNASIHSNDIIGISGSSFIVEGYGSYWNDGDTGTEPRANQIARFHPNVDHNGAEPNYFQTDDEVEIPDIDATALQAATDVNGGYRAGNLMVAAGAVIDFSNPSASFWGTHGITYNCDAPPCGTEENPFILYVTGTIETLGTARVAGWGVIYATGNVDLDDDFYGSISSMGQTQVLLATSSNILIPNNTCLGLGPPSWVHNPDHPPADRPTGNWNNSHCPSSGTGGLNGYTHGVTLYAEQSVQFQGNPFIVGGIISNNSTFGSGGNPWIAYSAPNETIVDPGFEYIVPIGPVLVSYSEW